MDENECVSRSSKLNSAGRYPGNEKHREKEKLERGSKVTYSTEYTPGHFFITFFYTRVVLRLKVKKTPLYGLTGGDHVSIGNDIITRFICL